jgi:nucleotide-binding universal stress UspA family protein
VETGHGAGAVFLPRREEEEQIINRLNQLESDLAADGLTVSLEVRDDPGLRPAHEIAAIAQAAQAELIVVATRGVSAIGGLVLGSVTHRLLHIAPCPVLVVPTNGSQRGN